MGWPNRAPCVLLVLGSSGYGGGTAVVQAQAEYLRAQGLEVLINSSDPRTVESMVKRGFSVIRIESFRRRISPYHDLASVVALYRVCRHKDIDIIHTHTSKAGFVGRLAGHLAKVPIILHTIHVFAFHDHSNPFTHSLYVLLERLASRWTDKLISVSEYGRSQAIQLGIASPDRVITVSNGIPFPKPSSQEILAQKRVELGLTASGPVVTNVGRLFVQKGVEYFIRAIPLLKNQLPDARFLVVGDGPLADSMQVLACKLCVSDVLHFTGFRRDIADILAISDVFVLPSLWEGQSIALLEAMAAGRPIVATDIAGNRELLANGATALLVSAQDSVALSNAILQLVKDTSLARRFGARAQQVYREHFTQEAMVQKTWEVYYEMICRKLPNLRSRFLKSGVPGPS